MLLRFIRSLLVVCLLSTSPMVLMGDVSASEDFLSVEMKFVNSADWVSTLQTGDVLLSESSDAMDFMVLLLYPRFSPFFHVGVVEVGEDKKVYVHDANGELKKLGSGDAPSDYIGGRVKRASLEEFVQEARTVSWFRPTAGFNKARLLDYLNLHSTQSTPFDPYFNSSDHTKLYCTEFVALAFAQAGGGHVKALPMRVNKSAEVVLDWMKVRDRQLIPAYVLVDPKSWLGTVSYDYSRSGLFADRSVKYELYRRFTANQKVGNVMDFGSASVEFRDYVEAFRERAYASLESRPDRDTLSAQVIFKMVHQLADDMLGRLGQNESMPVCQIDLHACAR